MTEPAVTLHHEATRKRSKALALISLLGLSTSVEACFRQDMPKLGIALFVVAFACAVAARVLRWWDHG